MPLKRPSRATTRKPSLALSTRTLGMAAWGIVDRMLAASAPDWSVELSSGCTEEACLVLLPEGGGDENGPSFVISQDGDGFGLDRLQWDVMHRIGTYETLADVVAAVRVRLAFGCCLGNPTWPIRH